MKTQIWILVASIASLTPYAHAGDGETGSAVGQLEKAESGTETSFTPAQRKEINSWVDLGKSSLEDLKVDSANFGFEEFRTAYLSTFQEIAKAGEKYRSETFMRFLIMRASWACQVIDPRSFDRGSNGPKPAIGLIDQEVKILKKFRDLAIASAPKDHRAMNAAGELPWAQFGIDSAVFMMDVAGSILSPKIRYELALGVIGMLGRDLMRSDQRDLYQEAIKFILRFKDRNDRLPFPSDFKSSVAAWKNALGAYHEIMRRIEGHTSIYIPKSEFEELKLIDELKTTKDEARPEKDLEKRLDDLSPPAGSYYVWDSTGDCWLRSNGGAWRGKVADKYCGGTYYVWDSTGDCWLKSKGGAWRNKVDDNACGGTHYVWDSSGDCWLKSKGGAWRHRVADSFCR